MKHVLAGIFMMFIWANSIAQTHSCGFDHIHQKELETNPEFRKAISHNGIVLQKYFQNNRYESLLSEDELVVPVVFHVIHTGEDVGVGNNISDQQIQECLAQLNEGWNSTQGFIDMNVRFQMATIDPDCNPTNGINRVDGRVVANYEQYGISASYVAGDEVTVKNLSKWPNGSYYNIWVVSAIDGYDGTSGSGTAGYAYFPGTGADKDGTVIINTQVGTSGTASPSNDGVTIIHEVGHGMGLYHTFEGDNNGNSCPPLNGCSEIDDGSDGDCVSDTEAHVIPSSLSSCPSDPTCHGRDPNGVQYNIMNYTNCQDRFTQGQKDRARAQLINNRPGLLVSKALSTFEGTFTPPSAASCTPQTNSTGTSGNYAEGLTKVALNGTVITSGATYSDGGYVDRSATCATSFEITEGNTYDLTTIVLGSENSRRYIKVWIDFNNDGSFNTSEEQIVDEYASANVDVDHSFTIPGTAVLNQSLRMRVLCDWSPIGNSCSNPEYGQGEDFAVIIRSANASTPPVAEFTASATSICAGESITFTDNSTNTPTSWSWSITGNESLSSTDQNPSFTFNTAGTYQVSLTATNTYGNDTETKTDFITVNALPTPTFSLGSSATVATTDGNQTLTALPSGGTFTGTGVTGSTFDPAIAGVGTHVVTYSYTDGITGCSATTTFTYTVTSGSDGGSNPPVADFQASSVQECAGGTIQFTDLSTNSPTSWSWTFTGGETLTSTDQNPSITFNVAGTYEVSLSVANSDGSDSETKAAYITVNDIPTVTFTTGSSATVSTTDGLQALTGDPVGGTYSGNGVTGTDFDPATAGVGTHTIMYSYTSSQGCSSIATFDFIVTDGGSVNLSPVADFSVSTNSECVGNTVIFTDQSTNDPTSWLWSITGPTNYTSQDQNPSISFAIAGTYSVSLTASNNSGANNITQSDIVVINPNPELNINSLDVGCYGANDGMISVTVLNGTTGNQYSIGGTTQSSGIFSNLQASTYSVTVIDDNTCFTMEDVTITEPTEITGSSTMETCPEDPVLVFGVWVTQAGEYSEVFTSASGCDSTHTIEVIVNDLPEITFAGSNIDTVDIDAGMMNIPTASPTGGTFSGSGVFGNQFNPAFAGEGTHELEYSYTDNFTGCTSTATYTFVVLGKTTGINDSDVLFTIHPNPTNGILNVAVDNLENINVYNAFGQLINTTNETIIDLSSHANGLYIIEVINSNGYSAKQRVIKN